MLTARQIKASPVDAEHYIESLVTENERLRTALEKIADPAYGGPLKEVAREALSGTR